MSNQEVRWASIGLINLMEGGGGSEDSHWPPGVHS